MHTLSECYFSELLYLCTIQSNAVIHFNSSNNYEFDTILACLSDHGVGSTDHLSRQTMRIKTVMNHNQENDQKNRPHDLDKLIMEW